MAMEKLDKFLKVEFGYNKREREQFKDMNEYSFYPDASIEEWLEDIYYVHFCNSYTQEETDEFMKMLGDRKECEAFAKDIFGFKIYWNKYGVLDINY